MKSVLKNLFRFDVNNKKGSVCIGVQSTNLAQVNLGTYSIKNT